MMPWRWGWVLGLCLACGLGWAATPVTPAEARALSDESVDLLVACNQATADDYYHHGEFLKAVDVLERIIQLDPHDVQDYASAAWLAWSAGQSPRAEALYQRLVKDNPESPDAYFEVGVYYMRIKNDAEAARWFQQAVAHGLTAPRSHLYGHTLARLGRTADALAFWQQLLAANPKDEVAKREAARLTPKP